VLVTSSSPVVVQVRVVLIAPQLELPILRRAKRRRLADQGDARLLTGACSQTRTGSRS
jgi:hypothetical protein